MEIQYEIPILWSFVWLDELCNTLSITLVATTLTSQFYLFYFFAMKSGIIIKVVFCYNVINKQFIIQMWKGPYKRVITASLNVRYIWNIVESGVNNHNPNTSLQKNICLRDWFLCCKYFCQTCIYLTIFYIISDLLATMLWMINASLNVRFFHDWLFSDSSYTTKFVHSLINCFGVDWLVWLPQV
jgi:hypothetical protein